MVGYTHQDWALTDSSRELLATRFRDKGIRLRIAGRPTITNLAFTHVHFLVLAEKLANGKWGQADRPGRTLVARSPLPVLGPNFHD